MSNWTLKMRKFKTEIEDLILIESKKYATFKGEEEMIRASHSIGKQQAFMQIIEMMNKKFTAEELSVEISDLLYDKKNKD